MLKFFLNSNNTSYLRGLESEFGESTNGIRIELNRFEKAGMLQSSMKGNKKFFKANTDHPLYKEVHNILLKYVGFDTIIEKVVNRLGDVSEVFVIGDYSNGIDSQIIDLLFIGNIDKNYLVQLIEKAEKLIKRKIRYVIYKPQEKKEINWDKFNPEPLLLWEKESV